MMQYSTIGTPAEIRHRLMCPPNAVYDPWCDRDRGARPQFFVPPPPPPAPEPVIETKPTWFWFANDHSDQIDTKPTAVTVKMIMRAVAQHFHLRMDDLLLDRRQIAMVRARQAAMHIARTLTRRSLPEIARTMQRDHTTVLHGLKCVKARMESDPLYASDIALIIERLAGDRRTT